MLFPLLLLHAAAAVGPHTLSVGPRLERWVRAALRSERSSPPPSAVSVYVTEPLHGADKVVAILPIQSSPRGGFEPAPSSLGSAHDAVLVLDPSPGENFGHPLLLFYVDMNVTKRRCLHLDGLYLGDECLIPAVKGRCQNQMKQWRAGAERIMGSVRLLQRGLAGLCQVHFLPLVMGVGDSERTQRLRCVERSVFASCPQTLAMMSPSVPITSCELHKNTRRCTQQPISTHLSCRLYQTCDHAVLIAGGWQQQMTLQRQALNLQRFYAMLRNNGFHREHIHTFLASSAHLPENVGGVFSATEKNLIRNQVSYVCRKQQCADSLVLYLNSPTHTDGSMLLWDADQDGTADLKERYTVSELLADLAGCRAARVLLFVDQSYSGVLAKRLLGSSKHQNVALIQNGAPSHRRTSEQTGWLLLSPRTCLLDFLGQFSDRLRLLQPWVGLLNVTLAGAPCDVTPPFTDEELQRKYQGCQNLPTALWYRTFRGP